MSAALLKHRKNQCSSLGVHRGSSPKRYYLCPKIGYGRLFADWNEIIWSIPQTDVGADQFSAINLMKFDPRLTVSELACKCESSDSAISFQQKAFTLVEVMVVMGLAGILMVAGMGALFSLDLTSRRTSDYNAALAVVEAKIEDVRAATYNPPNSPWLSTTTYVTNNASVALDKAGVTFQVAGTVCTKIETNAWGHLVTVTGTFQEPRLPFAITLQTVVNRYSGGQQ